MVLPTTMQGRPFGPLQLAETRGLLHDHPDWSRYQLSRALARQWRWHGSNGQLKDMAARTLLGKLALRGWIQLPALRRASPTRSGRRPPPLPEALGLDESPWAGPLGDLLPLHIHEVSSPGDRAARARLENGLHRHHYLGYQARVGENLQYWVSSSTGRPLACVAFGAAAWQCAPRDRWIGWTPAQRAAALPRVVNNTRFLVFPWVRVPHLASHVLGRVAARVAADWEGKYRHPIELLETFVDRSRFAGTCYRAANWVRVGQTKGRGRQGPGGVLSTPIKDVYLYPLHPDCRHRLCTPAQPPRAPRRSGAGPGGPGQVVGGTAGGPAEDP
ncbi:MAG: Druantia anti-phage system protein DruA [Actinomycetota bacterium]